MTDGCRIFTKQWFLAASACLRSQHDNRVTLIHRDQCELEARVHLLSATILNALWFVSRSFSMGMHAIGQYRRILRRQILDLGCEICDLRIQVNYLRLQDVDLELKTCNESVHKGSNRRSHLGVDFTGFSGWNDGCTDTIS